MKCVLTTTTPIAVTSVGIVILKPLPDHLRSRVDELRKKGDEFRDVGKDSAALATYAEAYDLILEPKIEWSPGCWLLDKMGEIHFRLGNFSEAAQCYLAQMPVNDESGALQLRLGECFFEMGELASATKHFSTAVELRGTAILDDLEPECLTHIHSSCPRPFGGWNDEIYEFDPWVDVTALREKARDASRMAIQRLAAECSGQVVYGFALCAFWDGFEQKNENFPSASTEANHLSRLKQHPNLDLR